MKMNKYFSNRLVGQQLRRAKWIINFKVSMRKRIEVVGVA